MLSLALLFVLGAVALLAWTVGDVVRQWWLRRIDRYATWMAIEFGAMFRKIPFELQPAQVITGAVVGALFLGLLLGDGVLGRMIAALFMGLGGYFGPWAAVKYLRKRRLEAIDNQLVDALGMMANALKSGLSLQQALELVTQEMKPPISDEVGRVVKEIHLGQLTDHALRRLAERVPLEDLDLAVDSILTLRETGGNLSESFQVIAQTIVERKKVQGKVKSLTAQGMAQGVLVGLMPVGMLLMFSVIDVSFVRPLFTTVLGWGMLAVVFVLDGMGVWLMFKLVKVDV
jgi:tight adherence protein B